MMKKVAVIGCGFVGNALINALSEKLELLKIDPKYGVDISSLKDFNAEYIFIYLPTPMMDNGEQDISLINEAITNIKNLATNAIVVIKSTILPNNINKIKDMHDKIILNPEFLREKHANEDFINSSFVLFGGETSLCQKLSNFYIENTKVITKGSSNNRSY